MSFGCKINSCITHKKNIEEVIKCVTDQFASRAHPYWRTRGALRSETDQTLSSGSSHPSCCRPQHTDSLSPRSLVRYALSLFIAVVSSLFHAYPPSPPPPPPALLFLPIFAPNVVLWLIYMSTWITSTHSLSRWGVSLTDCLLRSPSPRTVFLPLTEWGGGRKCSSNAII